MPVRSIAHARSWRAKLRRLSVGAILGAWALLCVRPALPAYEVPISAYNSPTHYYDTAAGTAATLRTNLHNIISSGIVSRNYGDSRYNMGTEFSNGSSKTSIDQDPNIASNIILIYNDASIPGAWDAGVTWNREHLWPKFWLDVTSNEVTNAYTGPASDSFELRPADPTINSSRSNYGYGFYPATTGNAGSYGTNTTNGGNDTYWFPGTADAGEVARAMFYMATRYYDPSNPSRGTDIDNLELKNGLPTKFNMGDLNSLLHWNYQYGVDNFERRRNQYIYGSSGDLTNHALNPTYYQGNRNPFVDHPEYVWAIFGSSANNSQISVGSPASSGSSSTTVTLGSVIVGSSSSLFGTSNVTVGKSGSTPTTFDITTSGNAVTPSGVLLAGTGHPFDYGSQSMAMTVGLNASTATAGLKSGTITIDNTDLTSAGTGQGSADGNDIVTVNGSVFNHANASFATPTDTNSLTVNVGTFSTGSGTQTANFNIYNLVNTPSFTAGLQYASQLGSGNTSQLTTNIASAFTGTLAAGNPTGVGVTASLNSTSAGTFAATYTYTLSDDVNIAGHTTQNISVTLNGRARGASTIYWTAAADSLWDLDHIKTNWTNLSSSDVYLQGDTVVFNDAQNPSGSRSVTLNNSVTPAAVTVDHSSGTDYTISGAGSIGGASATLTKSGSGKATLSTNNSYGGGTTVGAGKLVVGHVHALGNGGLAINGTATAQIQAALPGPVVLPSVTIAGGANPTATFDITDNNVIVHNGDLATLTAQAKKAITVNADWTGTGLTSTTARDNINRTTAVGVIQNDDGSGSNTPLYTTWPVGVDGGAVSVVHSDVLIKYTYYGDADLDGVVNAATDYDLWLTGKAGGGTGWEYGDFDYDGTINAATDYDLWLTGKAASQGNPLSSGGVQPVPEPGGGALTQFVGLSSGGVQPVPEPSTIVLATLGLAGLAAFACRRRTINT